MFIKLGWAYSRLVITYLAIAMTMDELRLKRFVYNFCLCDEREKTSKVFGIVGL